MNKITITLFATPDCPHCRTARAFLTGQGIDFVERDVSTDAIALQDMLFLLGRTEVPALYVGYQAAVGFDRDAWLEVLAHGREVARRDPFALPKSLGDDPIKL